MISRLEDYYAFTMTHYYADNTKGKLAAKGNDYGQGSLQCLRVISIYIVRMTVLYRLLQNLL